MIYQFRCCKEFEVSQPIWADHVANCPKCGMEAQRIYTKLGWVWGGSLFRPDGSRREDEDYAPVMGGR